MSPANLPPEPPNSQNDLLANQNHLRASRYVFQASTALTSRSITNIWLLHPPKAFFDCLGGHYANQEAGG